MAQEINGCDEGMERMERRIEKLEQDVSDVKLNVAVIKSDYVTRADLNASVNSLVKWIVGTAIALGAAGITVITFVLNNATPKAAPSQQPIVIYGQPAASSPVPRSCHAYTLTACRIIRIQVPASASATA